MRKTITLLAAIAFLGGELFAEEEPIQTMAEAVENIENRAKNGSSIWQFTLGGIYRKGTYGKILNHEKAFHWFLKSAKQGFTPAQEAVSLAYLDGRELKRIRKKDWLGA